MGQVPCQAHLRVLLKTNGGNAGHPAFKLRQLAMEYVRHLQNNCAHLAEVKTPIDGPICVFRNALRQFKGKLIIPWQVVALHVNIFWRQTKSQGISEVVKSKLLGLHHAANLYVRPARIPINVCDAKVIFGAVLLEHLEQVDGGLVAQMQLTRTCDGRHVNKVPTFLDSVKYLVKITMRNDDAPLEQIMVYRKLIVLEVLDAEFPEQVAIITFLDLCAAPWIKPNVVSHALN